MVTAFSAWGQQDSLQGLQAQRYAGPWQPVIRFDSVSVYPLHYRLTDERGHAYDTASFGFDAVHARIIWRDSLHPDSIRLTYYRYPPWWYARIRSIEEAPVIRPVPSLPSTDASASFFDGIRTQGFWEQGVMGGNRQQSVPQTRLDLRMQGPLSEKVRINAHIKDDNLPMGYEGVTTTFKDLNRVFINVQGPGWDLGGGDSLWQYQSDLLRFERDNRGMALRVGNEDWRISLSAASVKGRFKRQEFDLQTNQYGPFLLLSENGQRHIYILHGSEKVYLNGRRLKSGEQGDYTMDYMKARLQLHPSLRINQGDRLVVEYQYAAQDFARWSSWVTAEHTSGSARWQLFSYNETDLPRKTLLIPLDSQAIALLRQVPQASTVWIPAEKPVPYSPEKILYKKITAGGTSYYQYSTDSTAVLYEVRFSYAGQGHGDYVLDRYLAAGPVYKYAGPGRGDYLPGFPLHPPANRRYTGFVWQNRGARWQSRIEGVYQYTNPNMWYTTKDNRLHALALSWKTSYRPEDGYGWYAGTGGKWLPAAYRSPDPVEPDSRARQWGLLRWPGYQYRLTEFWGGYKGRHYAGQWQQSWLHRSARNKLAHSSWHLEKQTNSWQGFLDGAITWGPWEPGLFHRFQNWNARWQRQKGKWKPYAMARVRRLNRQNGSMPDSLNYGLYQWEAGTENLSGPWQWKFWLRRNRADSIRNGLWQARSKETTAGLSATYHRRLRTWHGRLQWVNDPLRPGRQHWDMALATAWHDTTGVYRFRLQANQYTGRILRNEIIFKEVPPGQGQYQWVDYNNDGIAQNNEFEPAYYRDQANYIMVVLPSTYSIPVISRQIEAEGQWHPQHMFNHPPFWARWHFGWQVRGRAGLETSRFTGLEETFRRARTAEQQLRYFQRWNPTGAWQAEYRLDWHRQKQLTYNGYQRRFVRRHRWALRYGARNGWQWEPFVEQVFTDEAAEDYPLKNLHLQNLTAGFKTGFEGRRSGWQWSARQSRKKSDRGQKLLLWQTQWEGRLRLPANRLDWRLTFARALFDGNPLSPDGFRMLEGLLPGNNWIGEIRWQKRLREKMSWQASYQIRYTPGGGAVHTGYLALKARF